KNSPYKGDVVREAAEACKRGGIKFGFYLSPWDRNSKYYGTPEYNDYFCNQLTELLTGYGDIFCVWFDNACGEGENGKKQEYDFPRYFELIRKYQPNAVIFNDFGPDTRWCGNEAGEARHAEWAVVPSELCFYSEVQTGAGPMAEDGSLSYMYNTNREIGTMPNILYSKGLVFAPAEIDMSIRPGWFWHENEEPHSLERLYNTYLRSCGANACLNLNVPPTREGKFDERDVKRLKELGDFIRETTENRIPCTVERIGGTPTQPVYELKTEGPVEIGCVVLREDLTHGQRVEGFRILGIDEENKADYALFEGTCIGNKHICELEDPFAVQNPLTGHTNKKLSGVRVQITAARDEVFMREIYITKGKSVCEQK
ncbi:MAG TPA: alpha-fucosidase, partial [Ruminococcaceae bacterium]|nr:alpha-fucosidase [Oscillospiraceae bacterium]